MNHSVRLWTTCLIVAVSGEIARGEMRTWTDDTGKYSARAEYLHGAENEVRLQLENGKKLTVRLSRLSEKDQQFVREQLASTKLPQATSGTTAGASQTSAGDAQDSVDGRGTSKSQLEVFGVKLGMSDVEVAKVLQRKGIRPADVRVSGGDNAFDKSLSMTTSTNGRAYPSIWTELRIRFGEDLPQRPGTWVCFKVEYWKDFADYRGKDLSPVWSKVRADLIERFGPPSEERSNREILFGDEDTQSLKASEPCVIELGDKVLAQRLRDTYEQLQREKREREATEQGNAVAETIRLDF
jgi:hypothetical protein